MLNLIIIILKKLSNPIYMGWVGLDFFLTHYGVLGWKNSTTWAMHTPRYTK